MLTGDWAGLRVDLDTVEYRKMSFPFPEIEPGPPARRYTVEGNLKLNLIIFLQKFRLDILFTPIYFWTSGRKWNMEEEV
jgi:hypothetical protein